MMPAQHIAFSIPLSEPLPPEYYLRLVSQVCFFFPSPLYTSLCESTRGNKEAHI